MKKWILLLTMLTVGATTAFAQLELIPKIGGTFSYFNEELEDEELEGRLGLQAGVDLRIGDHFYVQPGVHYFLSQNRINLDGDDGGSVDVDSDFKLQGLRIPVVIGAKLVDTEGFDLRLFGGGAAFLLLNRDNVLDDLIDNLNVQDNFWSINAGLGFDFGDLITLDLRHDWGLSNVFEDVDNDQLSRTNMVTLALGVRL